MAVFVSALLATVCMAVNASTGKPNVAILATGGTIAAVGTDSGYTAGQITIGFILEAVPQLEDVITVKETVQVSNIASQNFKDEIYVDLAKAIRKQVNDPDIAGVIVTHGTDTMAESAFLMDLMIKSLKPIVFVGSTRPATGISADGPANILDGARVVADPDSVGRGAMLVFGGEIHTARFVYKSSTESLSVFKSPNGGAIGYISGGVPRFYFDPIVMGQPHFPIPEAPFPKVAIIYAYGGMDAELASCAANYADGIVLCGTGNGNAADEVIDVLADAVSMGIPVVRSARTGAGSVSRNIELDDDALGFVASQDLNCQHARNMLQLALTLTTDPEEIQDYFYLDSTAPHT